MRKVLILDGVQLPEATAKPKVELTPEDRAMAHIPGWVCFFDPAYMEGGKARNMARPKSVAETQSGALDMGAFPNSAPAFSFAENNQIRPNIAYPTDAWTVFAAVRLDESNAAQSLVGAFNPPSSPYLSPQIHFSSDANIARISSRGVFQTRLEYVPQVSFKDSTRLVMFTGSTRDGLRIFDNGVEAASAPEDKAPIDAQYEAGEWRFNNGLNGLVGNMGLLDIDLGWPEHAGYRRSIERFLMDKYGIT